MSRKSEQLQQLAGMLEIDGIDRELIWQALTHSSYANEVNVPHNERLEFLGDAVLELLSSQALYEDNPCLSEGELTRMRANLVCEGTLADIARGLGLGELLLLGKSQLNMGGRTRPSLLADALEALLGVIYLEAGLARAASVYKHLFRDAISALAKGELHRDYKTKLQELVQKEYPGQVLSYKVVAESGPDHDKTFYVALSCSGRCLGKGSGRSKKDAEQEAAKAALRVLTEEF